MSWVLKPWVATQNWVVAYFVVGQRNDNGSHGSPTDLQYIYIYIYIYIYNENIFDGVFFLDQENFFLYESNMGRGTYTDTDNWVAAKISWEPRPYVNDQIFKNVQASLMTTV